MKEFKSHKFDNKGKNKNKSYRQYDEEYVSLKDVKRNHEHKKYRNFENVLRSKNVDALLEYEDDL